MKTIPLLLCSLFFSSMAVAQVQIVTDSGREVVLNEDGTWEFVSNDQFASMPDGERVRLRPDGSWQVEKDGPVPVSRLAIDNPESALRFTPRSLVIETRREKVGKNTRYASQTVIEVEVELSNQAGSNRLLRLGNNLIALEDSSGKEYSIVSVTPAQLALQPGAIASFTVRADDSPVWRMGKYYRIAIAPELASTRREVELRIPLSVAKDEDLE